VNEYANLIYIKCVSLHCLSKRLLLLFLLYPKVVLVTTLLVVSITKV